MKPKILKDSLLSASSALNSVNYAVISDSDTSFVECLDPIASLRDDDEPVISESVMANTPHSPVPNRLNSSDSL